MESAVSNCGVSVMKRGDMVRHATDGTKPRGLVTSAWGTGVLVQWSNGEVIRYDGAELESIVSLGWNLYVK